MVEIRDQEAWGEPADSPNALVHQAGADAVAERGLGVVTEGGRLCIAGSDDPIEAMRIYNQTKVAIPGEGQQDIEQGGMY